jgi:peroxiredoxin Q/BCP
MVLEIGKKAPAFNLPDKDGNKHALKDIDTDYTLLFFYPKDNTPGCTIESQLMNKARDKFAKLNCSVIGISGGDEKTKTKFCDKHDLKIPMLSDTDFTVSTKYDVYGEKKFMGRTYMGISRVSFLLDKDKKIIKVYEKVKPAAHTNEVLSDLKALQ